jgi:VWFA-related protein
MFRVTALFLLFFLAVCARAQEQLAVADKPSSREIAVTIKVSSNNPGSLHGLTKDDFKLAIGGKQRAVLSAEELANTAAAGNDSLAFNNLASLKQNKRLVVILLDEANMLATPGTDVYREMAKSMTSLSKGEANFMVLVADSNGLHLAEEITDDPAVVRQWLSKRSNSGIQVVKNEESIAARAASALDSAPYLIGGGSTLASHQEAWLRSGPLFSAPGRSAVQTAMATVDALQQVAQAMAGFSGQRSLIWVTGQVPFNFHHSEAGKEDRALPPEFLNTMSELDRDGIDLSLIETYLGFHGSQTSTFGVGLTKPDRYGQSQVLTGSSTNATMSSGTLPVLKDFAKPIGSRIYAEPGMLGKAVSEILKENSAIYYVRFTALLSDIVNGWVPAEITTIHAGASAAPRNGYYVSGISDPIETRVYDIRMAVRSPLQFTGLPLQASFGEPQALADGKRTIPFHVFVPPGYVLCDGKKDNLVLADLAYQVVDANGKEILAKVNPQQANLKPEQRTAFMTQGLNLDRSLDLPSGTYTVRFIVRDNLSGKIGTVFAPLKVE